MSSKKKPASLADKISDLLTSVPKSYGSDDEAEETKAKVVDFDYDDDDVDLEGFKHEFKNLKIRMQNEKLLEDYDERYKGKKVSKKEIFDDGLSSEEEYDEDSDQAKDASVDEPIKPNNEEDDISDQYSDKDLDNISNQYSEDKSDDNLNQYSEDESDDNLNQYSEDESDDNLNQDSEGESDDISSKDSENMSDDVSPKPSLKKVIKPNNEESNYTVKDLQEEFEQELFDSIDRGNPKLRMRTSEDNFRTMSRVNLREELEKGNCVREQLNMWENLLEIRIRFQRCLMSSNKMPQYDVFKNYQSDNEYKSQCTSVKHKLTNLLNNLLKLQSKLVNNFPETKDVFTKTKKRKIVEEKETNDDLINEEIPSDTENEESDNKEVSDQEELEKCDIPEKKEPASKKRKLGEFENILSKNHKMYKEFRDAVIQKWNDRTRIAAGIISKKANEPVLKQIEFILNSRDKLIKKTQLKRSEYDIIGKTLNTLEDNNGLRIQEYDTEIYDDDDFYHQLLRDLIEYKSTDITDPIQLSKQWIQLQNMRSKMKRKIDTRATKGRRIRYDVHNKMVSFMAPILVNDTWTDQAKDDLYRSLFGKIKPVGEVTKEKEEKREEEKEVREENKESKEEEIQESKDGMEEESKDGMEEESKDEMEEESKDGMEEESKDGMEEESKDEMEEESKDEMEEESRDGMEEENEEKIEEESGEEMEQESKDEMSKKVST